MSKESIQLLKDIIAIPSISKEEKLRADYLESYIKSKGISVIRVGNNLISVCENYDAQKPNLVLNSHIDTVKPNESYTKNPYDPICEDGKIYGLGSNDAGASVVSLTYAFVQLWQKELEFNLILLLSAEEEIGGANGIMAAVEQLPQYFGEGKMNYAIIGEPTQMQAAVAERGLIVIDGVAHGEASHVANGNGVNAIEIALDDILKLKEIKFDRPSDLIGGVKVNVCQIQGGEQHNIIPDRCKFVIDVRPNDKYTNIEIVELLSSKIKSKLTARSLRNKTSATPSDSPLMATISKLGITQFVSNTGSDWTKVNFTAVKMGVGDSLRSHRADEYIYESEIEQGCEKYVEFITAFAPCRQQKKI